MDSVIRSVVIKRFRSIPSERIEFDNPTFFVGRNGSGKSNLVDVFAFLSELMSAPLQAVLDKRGGIAVVRNRSSGRSYPPNLGLRLDFGRLNGDVNGGHYAFEISALPNYGFAVVREQCQVCNATGHAHWFDRRPDSFKTNVKGLAPALDPASLAMPLVGGATHFAPILRTVGSLRVYAIEPTKLREMQDPDSGTSLRSDGSNAASVLQGIERRSKNEVARIGEILAAIVPNTTRVETKKHGNKLSLMFSQEWGERSRLTFEAFNMSDGTLRVLGLLLAVFQSPRPALIAVEEPEATIHPGALGAVLDVLQMASREMQVIVTTHSPELLDAKWLTEAHLRIVDWRDGATRVSPLSEAPREALKQHLMGAGDLLRANALEAPELFEDVAEAVGTLFEDLA